MPSYIGPQGPEDPAYDAWRDQQGPDDPANEEWRQRQYDDTIEDNLALYGRGGSDRSEFDAFMANRDDVGRGASLYPKDPTAAANADWEDYKDSFR